MSELIGDTKVVIINMFTELKETTIKEVKEGIMTMSHQIDKTQNQNKIWLLNETKGSSWRVLTP